MKKPEKNAEKKTDTSWGASAEWYAEHLEGNDTYHANIILPNLLRAMAIKPGESVLDIACGNGFFSRAFAEAGAHVTASDIAPEQIDAAKKITAKGNITYSVSPAHKLPFVDDHSIDKAVIVLAIQNISEVKEVFAECSRVLKRGGVLYIVMNHPAFRIPKVSSWGWDEASKKQYRRIDSYMSDRMDNIVMNPGEVAGGAEAKHTVTFHRPLQFFFKALGSSGFAVSRIEEWISHRTSEKGPRQEAEDKARKEIPLFMFMECITPTTLL